MKSSAALLFSTLVFGSIANATLTKLPGAIGSEYIGTGIPISAGGNIGSSAGNGGGAFYGTVSPTLNPASNPTVNTAFWCIDDQTFFNPTEYGTANITLLSTPGWDLTQTQYTSVSSAAGYNWTNLTDPYSGSGNPVLPTSAQDRLLMAAFLIQQYDGYNAANFSQTTMANTAKNTIIQDAIWAITNNGAFKQSPVHDNANNGFHDVTDNSVNGVNYWIDQAYKDWAKGVNSTVSANSWAVVTWNVSSNGAVLADSNQTFLVAVDHNNHDTLTPEPGFYGALALGMSGLVFVMNRRRKSA